MLQTVQVRYYAQLREALKTSKEEVSLELPALEGEILERLAQMHPKQRDLFMASRVAVDDGYVDAHAQLQGFTGVDIISPVSGG